PVVFYDKCVGCGACARACPRDVIEMHPEEHKLFVYCKNRDKGGAAKKACKVACIACTLCAKDCPEEGGITMEDNLAVVHYETCPQTDDPIKRCPTKCIFFDEEVKMTRESYYASSRKEAV
ncbi:MAG: 4Fe-4S binding protein, partial [Thermodesulfobacteriota bacterium]